ncbi:MAG: Ig-like domain-containing protein, partial [Candidatus Heimdallarchaeota archaeon]
TIDIEVNASDNREIEYVEFEITLLNGECESQGTDTTEPYKWKWEEGAFFFRNIEIVAVDSSGYYNYDSLIVLKFF